ncbi:hypothetical protein K2P56_02785 [Patescibacteria group bacterium]|nr:hypothetical protein [Patescibacteria group bacterium]
MDSQERWRLRGEAQSSSIEASEAIKGLKKDLAIRLLQNVGYVVGPKAQFYSDASVDGAISHFGTLFALQRTRERNYADITVDSEVGYVDPAYEKRNEIRLAENGGLHVSDTWSDHYSRDWFKVKDIYIEDPMGKKRKVVFDEKVNPGLVLPTVRLIERWKENEESLWKDFTNVSADRVYALPHLNGFIESVRYKFPSILTNLAWELNSKANKLSSEN